MSFREGLGNLLRTLKGSDGESRRPNPAQVEEFRPHDDMDSAEHNPEAERTRLQTIVDDPNADPKEKKFAEDKLYAMGANKE